MKLPLPFPGTRNLSQSAHLVRRQTVHDRRRELLAPAQGHQANAALLVEVDVGDIVFILLPVPSQKSKRPRRCIRQMKRRIRQMDLGFRPKP